jgi:hypothetical protein
MTSKTLPAPFHRNGVTLSLSLSLSLSAEVAYDAKTHTRLPLCSFND